MPLPVHEGIRVHETFLNGRPAVHISSDTGVDSGTLRIPCSTARLLDRVSSFYIVDQDRRHPLLSPAVPADLTGLAPLLVQVGTNEMLLDDARRLAARAS